MILVLLDLFSVSGCVLIVNVLCVSFKRVCILLVVYFAVVDEVSYKCHLGPVHDGII